MAQRLRQCFVRCLILGHGERMGGRSEDAVRMMLRRAEAKLREMTRKLLG